MDFYNITIHIFLEMLCEWILEFYVISSLMFGKFKKTNNFIIKLIVGLLIIIAISYPLAIAYSFVGDYVWGRSLIYLFLFVVAVVHHYFLYKGKIFQILLEEDIAFLIQNTVYKAFALIYESLKFFGALGEGPTMWGYKGMYYSIVFGLIAIVYFALIRRIHRYSNDIPFSSFIVVISLATIFLSTVLGSVIDVYSGDINMYLRSEAPRFSLFIVDVASDLLSALLNIVIIIVFFDYLRRNALQQDINKMEYVIAKSEEHYAISRDTIESINIKCHDMKHQINKIVEGSLPKESIDEINESINIYNSTIATGNKKMDVVLMEKSLICDNHKISFTKLVDGKAVSFLRTSDILVLFGNLIDNAIEATKAIENEKQKYINLSVKEIGEGITSIECFNYYEGDIEFVDSLPKTKKKDASNHGFGVKSIRNIVDKYNGQMTITAKDNIFTVHIILYKSEPNK